VSLAGATFADRTKCAPSEPVSVLQIHGTADEIVDYNGGVIFGRAYPGATETVASWASYDGCRAPGGPAPAPLDLDKGIGGAETAVTRFAGCAAGTAVELWTMNGGGHIPNLSPSFSSLIVDFLFAHPKQRS
jgi:polyhydroxybutyrate depolymerase